MLISQADEAQSVREYHRVRASQELDRARFAGSTCARSAHLELARLHTERISSGASRHGPAGVQASH
jgi:hypothetical protein